ncbi:MAG TPA: gluconokinase [Gaiellaceae bacterium]|nr:gluconokinase [Gaiellaceae bacterium]
MRVLALDVGSSSTRACAYDERGRELGECAQRKYSARTARDGSAELDAHELVRAAEAVLEEAGDADAVGSSCFWHSLLLLDERDEPLTPVLLWQDRRAVAQAEALAQRLGPRAVYERTGCTLHPSYWPAKLAWLAEQGTLARAHRVVSYADYLFLRLTGELRTTFSSASGSGLLDLRGRTWDGELLEALGIGEELLPPLSDEPVGTSYPPLGDGACSNLGAGCVTPERAALMIGTSGAYRVVREGEPAPRDGLFSYLLDERRIVEGGSISDGGNLLAWLEETLKVETDDPGEPDSHGLTFLALLGGERSPGWNPRATGAIAGLTFEADPAGLRQAALEGVAYRVAEIAERMPEVREVVATGGALEEDAWWIQVFADVLTLPITASGVEEGSARGAAVHVLERLGVESEPAPLGTTYEPDPERAEIYSGARKRQRELYERLF